MTQLQNRAPIHAIITTNQNHWRAGRDMAAHLSVPVFAHSAAQLSDQPIPFTSVVDGETIGGSLDVIEIDGAAPGEIALFSKLEGGTLIVGDALINADPYGFTFLPAKYCGNQRKMRKSLRHLLDLNFDRLFFAHGTPILKGAKARLGDLFDKE